MTSERTGRQWQRRPVLGALVRAAVYAVPVVLGVVAAVVLVRVMPQPTTYLAIGAWFIAVLVGAILVMALVQRLTLRLLPLAALLGLALEFPGPAPSRLGLASRASSVRTLEERLDEARVEGLDDEPTRAAATVLMLVAGLGEYHEHTRGHSERTRMYADMIAQELELSAQDRDLLRWSSLLHDIGRLAVPHAILDEPGAPDDEEWLRLRAHPVEGARISAPLAAWLGPWRYVIEEHHEKWDGSGYPYGRVATASRSGRASWPSPMPTTP